MPTDKNTNRAPAPKIADERLHPRFGLFDANGNRTTKFPAKSPLGTLDILRFAAPSAKWPRGYVVAKGYVPFDPTAIGMCIAERN